MKTEKGGVLCKKGWINQLILQLARLGRNCMEPEEIERKLQIIDDMEKIKRLQYRYINSLSVMKWDDIVDCFPENGEVDLGYPEGFIIKGKEAISKLFKEGISKAHVGKEGLFVVHPVIDVDGDRATGKFVSYFMHLGVNGQPPMVDWVQGVYDCKYIKVNNQWKISLLKWRPRLKYTKPDMVYIENNLL